MLAPPQASAAARDPGRHFAYGVDDLLEYPLRDLEPRIWWALSIHSADNQHDKPIVLSFRRREQISRDVLWSVFEKVTQSNARYQVRDTLTFNVNSVTRVVRELRSTDAIHRAMPCKLFSHASRTTLGSPAMSVTGILGTSLATKITNI
jgi:hypothetical protein